jgi:hypothetical protein
MQTDFPERIGVEELIDPGPGIESTALTLADEAFGSAHGRRGAAAHFEILDQGGPPVVVISHDRVGIVAASASAWWSPPPN